MSFKSKTYFSIFSSLVFAGLLFLLGYVAVKPLEASDNASEPEVLLSANGLEQRSLTLVSSSPLVAAGHTLSEDFVYDDPTTKRPADYFELYDTNGDLLGRRLV